MICGPKKVFIVLLVLTGGFFNYSNLFCAEHHAHCSHARHAHHDEDNSDFHMKIDRVLDPFHALSHTNQLYQQITFDSADHFCACAGLLNDTDSAEDFDSMLNGCPAIYLNLKFLSLREPVHLCSQLLI